MTGVIRVPPFIIGDFDWGLTDGTPQPPHPPLENVTLERIGQSIRKERCPHSDRHGHIQSAGYLRMTIVLEGIHWDLESDIICLDCLRGWLYK